MTKEIVTIEVKLSPIVAELLAVLDRDVAHLPRPPAPRDVGARSGELMKWLRALKFEQRPQEMTMVDCLGEVDPLSIDPERKMQPR